MARAVPSSNASSPGIESYLRSLVIPLALPVTILVLWQSAVSLEWWPRTLIAEPLAVLAALVRLIENGTLFVHTFVSLERYIVGFICGFVPAITLGAAIGLFKVGERAFLPTLQTLAPVPVIAWIPLLIIVFGISGARIALISVGTFFAIVFATFQGIRSVDYRLIELARVFEKSNHEMLLQILVPSALPNIIQATRLALAVGWILLLAGEVIASSSGLGWLIWNSRIFARPDEMFAGMVVVGCLGALTDGLMSRLEARLQKWRLRYEGE